MSILESAELLLQAKNYSGSGNWLDEANSHDAVNNGALFVSYSDDGFQWVRFPGTTGNFMADTSEPDEADIAAEATATIAIWARTRSDVATFDTLFSTGLASASGVRFGISGATAGRPRLTCDDGPTAVHAEAAGAVSQDAWHHIVATIDHTSAVDEAQIWIDGSTSGSAADISTLNTITAEHLAIGAVANANQEAAVDIAYVEMYKDLATSAEISTASNGGVGTGIAGLTGAVTVVNFADKSMLAEPYASFTDPQSNVYTIQRSSSGLMTKIVAHDQWVLTTNDELEVADDAGLDFAAADNMTVMAVFETNTVASGSDVIVAKKDNLTTSLGYALVRATATAQGIIADGTLDDDDTVATVAVHTLHTAAFVRNTTDDDIEAFLDGTGSGSATTDSTTTTLANAFPLRIGATSDTAASFFEGDIAAVAIWRSALTDAEILEAHGALSAGGGHPHNRNVTAGQLLLTG